MSDASTEATGAATSPPEGAIVPSGGPLSDADDDASSPGIEEYRRKVSDSNED